MNARPGFLPPAPRAPWAAGRALLRRLGVACAALAAAACTTLPEAPLPPPDAECQAWAQQLDAAVAQAGVADAEAERIAGVAGLRVDRVGEALRDRARADDAAYRAWLQRAAALDEAGRAAEIANLPAARFPLRAGAAAVAVAVADREVDREAARALTDRCRQRTLQQLASAPGPTREALLARAQVPDRYSLGLRALGLYPLVRWPFFAGVQRWQAGHEAAMARWAVQPPPLQRHVPATADAAAPPPWPPATDALGLPQPTPEQARQLLAWHAPVLEIEQRGPYDRFGTPAWGDDGRPRVDDARPVVWQRIAHMPLAGQWRLQLVYLLWFPERPPRSSFDLLAGALDGVMVRLTLGADGRPLLVDTAHACGCYHQFFPSAALRLRPGAPRHQEWLFAPATMPALPDTHRLVVRIASASHDVLGLQALPRDEAAGTGTVYALQPDQALRSLPAAGGRRSLYGPDGLVSGTERGERHLFWPMGIDSAGAMRQWGHHATAFVGRRHFDDAMLLEERFEWVGAGADSPAPPAARGR
jgi:hypothetical protein